MPSYVNDIIEWSIRIAFIPIVARQHRVGVALAWLAFIFSLPWIGAPLYLLFGEYRFRRGIRKHAQIRKEIENQCSEAFGHFHAHEQLPDGDPKSLSKLTYELTRREASCFPVMGGNTVELITDTDRIIERMIQDIDEAKHHVHMEYFIFNDDESGRAVAEAMARAAERGVACRLLADSYASRNIANKPMFRTLKPWLEERGVQVHSLLPVNPLRRAFTNIDIRNHRKITIIDGQIGYTGSLNIHNPDFRIKHGQWKQMMVRMEGPVVSQLQVIFVEDWYFESQNLLNGDPYFPKPQRRGNVAIQCIASGPTYETNLMQDLIIAALSDADKRVVITTPYFVLDDAVRIPFRLAAMRGADLDLILPEHSDRKIVDIACRAHFGELLKSGVRIHFHQKGFLHTKSMTIDDTVSFLGTANFDNRSIYLNYEVAVLIYDQKFTRKLRACQLDYLEESRRFEWEEYESWSKPRRMFQSSVNLLGPLL